MNLELMGRDLESARERGDQTERQIQTLLKTAEMDGRNIRALALVVESHHVRLQKLDGGEA